MAVCRRVVEATSVQCRVWPLIKRQSSALVLSQNDRTYANLNVKHNNSTQCPGTTLHPRFAYIDARSEINKTGQAADAAPPGNGPK